MEDKYKTFRIPYKKTVWGWLEVLAESKEKAQAGEYIEELYEWENKSDYETDDDKIEEM